MKWIRDKYKPFMAIFGIIFIISGSTPSMSEIKPNEDVQQANYFFTLHTYTGAFDSVAFYIAKALEDIGINLDVSAEFADFVGPHVFGKNGFGNETPPIYENGGFDIIANTIMRDDSFGIFPYNESLNGYYNTSNDNIFYMHPYRYLNLTKYNNPQYYNLLHQLQHSKSEQDAQNVLIDFIRFLDNESIFIPLYEKALNLVYADALGLTANELNGLMATQIESPIFSEGWAKLKNPNRDTLKIGFWDLGLDVHPWDYAFSLDAESPHVNFQSLVWQSLYQRDYSSNFAWKPVLASDFPVVSPDGLTVTVPLKHDIKFADGTNFTAYDVVGSYQIAMTDPYSSNWMSIDMLNSTSDIKVLDNYTVQFKLNYQSSFYMEMLKLNIVPTHAWGNYTTDYIF